MTYEEAIKYVRCFEPHIHGTDKLDEAAEVLEKERKRWDELRQFISTGLAISAATQQPTVFKTLEFVLAKMNNLEKQ